MIDARIIADSLSPAGARLPTFVLTYPRFIHSELMTHRAFSRNAASSRAIPIGKMIAGVINDPAMPVYWGLNKKGMQATAEMTGLRRAAAVGLRRGMRYLACAEAYVQSKLGTHKQVANRILEPWAHMTTIVSATEWGNFFNLRAHKDAQPEFQELAFKMLQAFEDSCPQTLCAGEWHLPFANQYSKETNTETLSTEQLIKITVARCARVSYLNFEGNIDHEKDYALHDDLLKQGHMSPFEHAAMATQDNRFSGNFKGFIQYRKTICGENRVAYDAALLFSRRGK